MCCTGLNYIDTVPPASRVPESEEGAGAYKIQREDLGRGVQSMVTQIWAGAYKVWPPRFGPERTKYKGWAPKMLIKRIRESLAFCNRGVSSCNRCVSTCSGAASACNSGVAVCRSTTFSSVQFRVRLSIIFFLRSLYSKSRVHSSVPFSSVQFSSVQFSSVQICRY